jgi:hypothetical protein
MKLKHNKKRNTAFLFESLTKELTKAILVKDPERKRVVMRVLRESFKKKTHLHKELTIYKSLLEDGDLSARQAEKVYREACRQYAELDSDAIFQEQTELINKINKFISPDVFDNFVPSYTAMATAYQLFNNDLAPKNRVVLEEQMLSSMVRKPLTEATGYKKVPSDKLIMKTYLKKFNKEFGDNLLAEQKTLLQKYVNSFSDNGLGLKVFLNEELIRIREIITNNLDKNESFGPVVETIDGFKGQWITAEVLEKIMNLQSLAQEVEV